MITCNPDNFRVTRDLGFTIQGLKAQHRRKVQRVESSDRILFYVYDIRCFTATATATSSYFEDKSPIWQNEGCTDWPFRIQIKPEVVLDEDQYINANLLAPRLEYIRRWPPEDWYMAFQGNLHLLPKNDFFLIEEEMKKLKFGRNYSRVATEQPSSPLRERTAHYRRRRPSASTVTLPESPPDNRLV
jgi:hypothetical protein